MGEIKIKKILSVLLVLSVICIIIFCIFSFNLFASDTAKSQILSSEGYNQLDNSLKERFETFFYSTGFISDNARNVLYNDIEKDNYFSKSQSEQVSLLKSYISTIYPFEYAYGDTILDSNPFSLSQPESVPSYKHYDGSSKPGYKFTLSIGTEQTINIYQDTPNTTIPLNVAKAISGFSYDMRKYLLNIYCETSDGEYFNVSNSSIWVKSKSEPALNTIQHAFAHELAHVLVNNIGGKELWNTAAKIDLVQVSGFGYKDPENEDIAEFSRIFYRCHKDPSLLKTIKSIYPNRYREFMNLRIKSNASTVVDPLGSNTPVITNTQVASVTPSSTLMPSLTPTAPNVTTSPVTSPTISPTITSITNKPSNSATVSPSVLPSSSLTPKPVSTPTQIPTIIPTNMQSNTPTIRPVTTPTIVPTNKITTTPTNKPSITPTNKSTVTPTEKATISPTNKNTSTKTPEVTKGATLSPSTKPTKTHTSTTKPSDNKKVDGPFIVSYSIQNNWDSGVVSVVSIYNNTYKEVNGWKIDWKFSGNDKINTIWNAEIIQDNNNSVSIKNLDYNSIIPIKGSVHFGFTLNSKNNPTNLPTKFTVNGQAVN